MRNETFLNTAQPTKTVSLEWSVDGCAIINLTPYPVLVRRGGTDIPTLTNYDFIIPAGGATNLSVTGYLFAFQLILPAQLPTNASEFKAQIILYECTEVPPSFGTQYFNSRAQYVSAILANNQYQAVIETFGARFLALSIIHNAVGTNALFPLAGALVIEQSHDGITYAPYRTENLWGTTTSRKNPSPLIATPANYIRVTIKAYEAMSSVVLNYALLDQSTYIPEQPYTFTMYSHTDASSGIWNSLTPVTLVDKDMAGTIEYAVAYIADGGVPLTMGFRIVITIDNAQPVSYPIGAYLPFTTAASENRSPIPVPMSFYDAWNMNAEAYLYHIPLHFSIQNHLKITLAPLFNTIDFGKFYFVFEDNS